MDLQKLHMCQDLLFNSKQEQEAAGTMMSDEAAASSEHQIVEKYGGVMKRYGGFMSHRSSAPSETKNDLGNQDEEENIRILNIISSAREHGSNAEMHGDTALGNLLEEVLGRGLKKRYGGFMRRVGRPEWLVNGSKSGGALKRAWEDSNMLQKRYGGFMD